MFHLNEVFFFKGEQEEWSERDKESKEDTYPTPRIYGRWEITLSPLERTSRDKELPGVPRCYLEHKCEGNIWGREWQQRGFGAHDHEF